MRAPLSRPNHLPEALPSNSITLGLGYISILGTQKHSVHCSDHLKPNAPIVALGHLGWPPGSEMVIDSTTESEAASSLWACVGLVQLLPHFTTKGAAKNSRNAPSHSPEGRKF